jgi:hypothetical protein
MHQQALDLVPRQQPHARPMAHPLANHMLEQVARGEMRDEVRRIAWRPSPDAEERDLPRKIHLLGAARFDRGAEAREQDFQFPLAAQQQVVQVAPLRDAGPAGGDRGQIVALDEQHLVDMVGQHARGTQPGHARADDDRAAWGVAGDAHDACAPARRLQRRVDGCISRQYNATKVLTPSTLR